MIPSFVNFCEVAYLNLIVVNESVEIAHILNSVEEK